ncbi:MAG: TilS substrate-binding domain-containing protein, partial [Verrucomicrobiales bacterium]
LPLALQRRLLFLWMKGQKVSNVDFDLIERARTLILPDTETAKVNLPKDRHLRRRQKQLFIEE